jgi:hypothetical protein
MAMEATVERMMRTWRMRIVIIQSGEDFNVELYLHVGRWL